MNTNLTRSLSLFGLMLTTSVTTQANDIVDFLRAINGNSGHRPAPVAAQPVGQFAQGYGQGHGQRGGQGYGQGPGANPGFDRSGHGEHQHVASNAGPGFNRPPVGNVNLRPGQYIAPPSRNGLQVNLRFASNTGSNQGYGPPAYIPAQLPPQPQLQQLPPVQQYPPQQYPVQQFPAVQNYPVSQGYPGVVPAPFELGQFVNCQVPLATCVRVEHECNIAPNAIPVVVAVRDPHMCDHDVQERLVFVQIFVPPCPVQNVRVSRCRTKISLDFGRYEVDIKSANGIIVVDYDN